MKTFSITRILPFLCFASMTVSAIDLTFISPAEGEQFEAGSALIAPNIANGVPVIVATSERIPNGSQLEIYVNDGLVASYGPTSSGPSGNGLPWRAFRLAINSTGTKVFSARIVDGGNVADYTGPSVEMVETPVPSDVQTAEATNITLNRLQFNGAVDNRGNALNTYYFEYGTTTDYGSRSPAPAGYIQDPFKNAITEPLTPTIPLKGWALNLIPSTQYHYRLVVGRANSQQLEYGPDMVATTAANLPPVARDDIGVLTEGGVSRVYPISNDDDESGLSSSGTKIVATSAPAHGTVTIDESGNNPVFVYNADASFETIDEFTYTLRDPYGLEATARVVIRSLASHRAAVAGDYATIVPDGQRGPVGSVTMKVTKSGLYTGALTYRGAHFPFIGRITIDDDSFPTNDLFEFARPGFEPLRLTVGVFPNIYDAGVPYIVGILTDLNKEYELQEAPQLLPLGVQVPEAGQFNVGLPNPEAPAEGEAPVGLRAMKAVAKVAAAAAHPDATGKPQGHGFSIVKLTPRGQLRAAGRLGDNKPFATSARMRRDRKVQILSQCGWLNAAGYTACSASM
jgi:hypothetical protein